MKLHLLKNRCAGGYATFGSCWNSGEAAGAAFSLTGADGRAIPVQTEIAARWPDGSVKWARHTADTRRMGESATVTPGGEDAVTGKIAITEDGEGWRIDAGLLALRVPKAGADAIARDVALGGDVIVRAIRPVMKLERRRSIEGGEQITVTDTCVSVTDVKIECAGPLEATVRYAGYYEAREQLMPFVIRMYIGLDSAQLRFDHTLIYNGVEERDFLKGMGLRFETVLSGPVYNRHVRFVTDRSVFHEPAALMEARLPRTGPGMKTRQMKGEMLTFAAGSDEEKLARDVCADVPHWNTFALTQLTADSFRLQKRTKPGRCFVNIMTGKRAPGAMAVSGETGGVMLGLRDFWQRYPSGLEADAIEGDAACTVWMYSPQAEAYDLRHYDDRAYPMSNYEGYPRYGASADGIAVTSRIGALLFGEYPGDEALGDFCVCVQKPAVYVADPEEYHEKRAFGYWSLVRRDTPEERDLEDKLAGAVAFYKTQIEQRGWYGLFDYGDVMHSYDAIRHCWKYDIGGCAWQNTELVPTYWLWLYFMRTGREDVFSLAEAMSRHAMETDIYHHGPKKGIGSRHNVRHWGCPCKEPRVSMAGHHRPMLYLTGDRRTGEVMDEVIAAADSFGNLYYKYTNYPGATEGGRPNARTGPDWSSFVSNWMTAYERTLNPIYREKIEAGIRGIAKAPMRLGSGPAFSFDSATGGMHYIGEFTRDIHLTLCMGAVQVWMETADMLGGALFKDMLAEYGKIYMMTDGERREAFGDLIRGKDYVMNYVAAALAAYGASRTDDKELARRAWEALYLNSPMRYKEAGFVGDIYAHTDGGEDLEELSWISTNYASQWCLNVICALDLIRGELPPLAEAKRLAAMEHDIAK